MVESDLRECTRDDRPVFSRFKVCSTEEEVVSHEFQRLDVVLPRALSFSMAPSKQDDCICGHDQVYELTVLLGMAFLILIGLEIWIRFEIADSRVPSWPREILGYGRSPP